MRDGIVVHYNVFFIQQRVKMFYKDFKEYGSPIDCYWKSSDTIQVKVTNKPDGWTVHTSDYEVSA